MVPRTVIVGDENSVLARASAVWNGSPVAISCGRRSLWRENNYVKKNRKKIGKKPKRTSALGHDFQHDCVDRLRQGLQARVSPVARISSLNKQRQTFYKKFLKTRLFQQLDKLSGALLRFQKTILFYFNEIILQRTIQVNNEPARRRCERFWRVEPLDIKKSLLRKNNSVNKFVKQDTNQTERPIKRAATRTDMLELKYEEKMCHNWDNTTFFVILHST